MTSLKEHTGRPEVAPWLRGWVEDEVPQTTVVWRRHLPVQIAAEGGPIPPRKGEKEVEDFFEAAPLHESEKLETETHRVVSWLAQRAAGPRKPAAARAVDADNSSDAEAAGDGTAEPETGPAAPKTEKLQRGDIAALVLSPGGDYVGHYALGRGD